MLLPQRDHGNKNVKYAKMPQIYLTMTHLLECELFMHKKRQKKAPQNEKIMAKCIDIFIVRAPHHSVQPHAPHDRQRAPNEHQLHHSIIDRDEVCEQIQVASHKHYGVQLLCLKRNPFQN